MDTAKQVSNILVDAGLHPCWRTPPGAMPEYCGCADGTCDVRPDHGWLNLERIPDDSEFGGSYWYVREFRDGRTVREMGPFVSRRDAFIERYGFEEAEGGL